MTDWTPPAPQGDENVDTLYPSRPAWHARAACHGLTDLFFTEGRGAAQVYETRQARTVCAGCPVLPECRQEALRLPYAWPGVWGGMTQKDRANAKARRPAA